MEPICSIPKCKSTDYDIIYYGYQLCECCWNKYADNPQLLKKILRLHTNDEDTILMQNIKTAKKSNE